MGSQENTIMISLSIAVLYFLGAQAAPGANEMRNEEPLTISPDLIPMRKTVETTSEPLTISPNLILNRAINTCECAKATSSGRIVGGKEVSPKYKLPYQVMFQAGPFMCGGTIINKRSVITAAHCLYEGQTLMQPSTHSLLVMIGEHSICDGANEGGKVIKVEKVHVRSDYGTPRSANDFAILKLAEDIQFTANIKPACLPEKEKKDYSGLWAVVSGWGGTVGYNPGAQVQQPRQCELKETSVKILKSSNELCTKTTDGDSKTRMCAFAKGTDSCQGDSGGPMTVVENGKYALVGVVSYGAGCASSYPGVYARVQNYLPWIKQLTADGECKTGSTSVTTAAPATTVAPATTAAPVTTAAPATTAAPTTATSAASTSADDYNYSDNSYSYHG